MTRTNPLSMQQVYLIPEAFLSGSKQVRTPADAGYEPNALSCFWSAMAVRRGFSMPVGPMDGGGGVVPVNPFWSERAKAERRLQDLRPGDLPPVPGGDSDEMEEVPALTADSGRGRPRSRSGGERGKGTGETIPRSSTGAGRAGSRQNFGGLRSSGVMPGEAQQDEDGVPLMGRGSKPEGPAPTQDQLQRELEKEVVEMLRRENQQLKDEVARLQQGQPASEATSGWSEVMGTSGQSGLQPPQEEAGLITPPRPTSLKGLGEDERRFTPGGTMEMNIVGIGLNCHLGRSGPKVMKKWRLRHHVKHRLVTWPSRDTSPTRSCWTRDGVPTGRRWSRDVFPERRWASRSRGRKWKPYSSGSLSLLVGEGSESNEGGIGGHAEIQFEVGLLGQCLESFMAVIGLALIEYTRAGNHSEFGGDRAGNHGDLGGDRAGIPGVYGGDRAGSQGGCRGDRAWHGREDPGDSDLEEKDTPKAVPVTLPALPAQEGRDSGIVCGDWMVQVRLLIGDVAPNALQLQGWDDLMAEVMTRYQHWLQAGPLERLQMPSPQQDGGRWPHEGLIRSELQALCGAHGPLRPGGGENVVEVDENGHKFERPGLARVQQSLDSKAAALMGAGTALVCGSEHKKLGAVLLATGMVVNWWEEEKSRASGPTKAKGQSRASGPTKAKGQSSAVGQVGNQKQEPKGHQDSNRSDENPGFVALVPGLRAMRRDPAAGSHGKGSTAAARGAAVSAAWSDGAAERGAGASATSLRGLCGGCDGKLWRPPSTRKRSYLGQ